MRRELESSEATAGRSGGGDARVGRHDRLRRIAASGVAVGFAVAVVLTGMVSLGAYCLTTDGGDVRRLHAAAPLGAGRHAATEGGSAMSCPIPAQTTSGEAAGAAGVSASLRRSEVPPIDRRSHAELETATFALG